MKDEKVEVFNVNTPGRRTRVNAAKYRAMRAAMLAALPEGAAPLPFDEIVARLRPALPESLFPGGATSGWWAKTVQLDLEARGEIRRHDTRPLTFSRAPQGGRRGGPDGAAQ
ncbi:MAG: hypothetical protein D6801_06930 [Alphaproteobacteria bacterium]|nr:MAG: hypothetical protein D6801_06930 [Alphaproteobacteria bacterium]